MNVVYARDETGKSISADLEALGNVLIIGSTGSGKTEYLYQILPQVFSGDIDVAIIDLKRIFYHKFEKEGHPNLYKQKILIEPKEVDELFASLIAKADNEKTGCSEHKPFVVVVDELGELTSKQRRALGQLMSSGAESHLFFYIATQCPAILPKRIRDYFQTKVGLPSGETDSRLVFGDKTASSLKRDWSFVIKNKQIGSDGVNKLLFPFDR